MKRPFGLMVLCLVLALSTPVAAQEATPQGHSGSLLAQFGFQELHITYSENGVDLPDQIEAGRTLIVYENTGQESTHPFMLRLPDDVTLDQALADLGPEAMEPPAWFLDAHFPGFVGETLGGETSYAVVDLVAGTHVVLHDSPVAFEVVSMDGTPAAMTAPESDATVNLFEMGFEFPETIMPGPQVWEVSNIGEVPHEILLVGSAVPVTGDQIIELFSGEDANATPVGGGPSFADIEPVPVGGVGWLSPGETAWAEVNLEPGTYAALCFVFDPETGMPHLMLGMVEVFTVGEDGTPSATPES